MQKYEYENVENCLKQARFNYSKTCMLPDKSLIET